MCYSSWHCVWNVLANKGSTCLSGVIQQSRILRNLLQVLQAAAVHHAHYKAGFWITCCMHTHTTKQDLKHTTAYITHTHCKAGFLTTCCIHAHCKAGFLTTCCIHHSRYKAGFLTTCCIQAHYKAGCLQPAAHMHTTKQDFQQPAANIHTTKEDLTHATAYIMHTTKQDFTQPAEHIMHATKQDFWYRLLYLLWPHTT